MSDFFANLHSGIRQPEVVMNSGPLPPEHTNGMPAGLDGNVDAKINYTSSLLGDLDPYAYGEPNYLSTQTSYLNVPNRIQKIIPSITLPAAVPNQPPITISHPVDDGDIAFAVKLPLPSYIQQDAELRRLYGPRHYNAFVNLQTVNYILSGISCMLMYMLHH